MSEDITFLKLIDLLEDSTSRENTIEELIALGAKNPNVANELYPAQFRKEGEAQIAIYRVLADLGDQMYKSGEAERITGKIIQAMEIGAKKSRQWVSDVVHNLSKEALTRWGLDVPAVSAQPILFCHICGKKLQKNGNRLVFYCTAITIFAVSMHSFSKTLPGLTVGFAQKNIIRKLNTIPTT